MNERQRLKEIIGILKDNDILGGINPTKFCTVIEQLGPTFIKIGQIMSNRVDIFPKEYCDELSKLRSSVAPMSFDEVEAILMEEYDDYKEIFKDIDENCIGSASIAQVHRANLITGERVVVKIQRRGIYQRMAMDIKLLKKAISLLHLNYIFKVMDLNEALDQIFASAKEEMNFEIEASHIEEFNNNNKDIVYVRGPMVYKNLSTTKVLVMEEVTGTFINDVEALVSSGYDTNEIGLKLCNNYMKQALDDGFFHADPHSDNIVIQDGKIVFIDFGMMGRVSNRDRELLRSCIVSIVKNDIYGVERALLGLSNVKGEVNHIKLRRDIENILSKNGTLEIKDTDTLAFINSMFKMLQSNNIKLDKNITMLVRGIGVIEGVLELVSPDISLFEVLSNKVKEEAVSEIFNKENAVDLTRSVVNSGSSMIKIPSEVLRLISSINRGEVSFGVELNDSAHKIDKLESMLHQIVIGFLDAALILGASIVKSILLRNLYITCAFVMSVWLFIKMYFDHRDKG